MDTGRSQIFANSYGTSWADQWDNGADPYPEYKKKSNKSKKVGEGFDKVKQGSTSGFNWIKEKLNKKKDGQKN
ncbi:hypothetical protein ACHQM5_005861 [Ranunculus cassubicifolius]